MHLFITALVVGFLLLMWSADKFANNALQLGQHFHISKFVIGVVVLGFGTSTPELLVSGLSAWQGNPGLAIGNAIGSNTTNILLILGVTLCILPLSIDKRILRRDFFMLIGVTTWFTVLILDQKLNIVDGIMLVVALLLTLYLLTRFEQKERLRGGLTQAPAHKSLTSLLVGLLVGLTILLLSSKLVVWSAVSIAEHLGVSDLIIGLTIIAIGTSLPELATCVASAMKKHSELALGNIIGSNVFNTLGVTGTASLITVYSVPRQIYMRDLPIMLAATLVLFLLAWVFLPTRKIPRGFGILFIAAYCMYIFFIYQQTL